MKIRLQIRISLTLIFIGLLLSFSTLVLGQKFISKYSAKSLSENCYSITKDFSYSDIGAIWSSHRLDLSKPFELTFAVYFGNTKEVKIAGGDGIAFVIHNDAKGYDAIGDLGEGIGFADAPSIMTSRKIAKSIAIEFDTYQNSTCQRFKDPSFDHTTVVYNGDCCSPQFAPIEIDKNNLEVEDNKIRIIKILWKPAENGNPDEISLWVNNYLRFIHKDYMARDVIESNNAYFGFTGSSGGQSNDHVVSLYNENSIPEAGNDVVTTNYESSAKANVLSNDKDPDGSKVFLGKLLTVPSNGIATISGDTIIYTPNKGFSGRDSVMYKVCDLTAAYVDKPYSLYDSAWLYIDVACPLIDISVRQTTDSLIVNSKKGVYQWYNCETHTPLSGQTNSFFVPASNGRYSVSVTVDNCSVQSECLVVTKFPIPKVNNISPTKGIAKDRIFIEGVNFTNVVKVKFNGVSADFKVLSTQLLSVIIPENSTSGKVSVETSGGIAFSPKDFQVIKPIEAPSDLSAVGIEQSIVLSWIDNSDNENGFIIEKFINNEVQFRAIDTVHKEIVTYEDFNFNSTISAYKVQAYNSDTKSDYSNMVTTKPVKPTITAVEDALNSLIDIYPNPGNGIFSLNVKEQTSKNVHIKVFDTVGSIIFNKTFDYRVFNSAGNIDISDAPEGVYFIIVELEDKTVKKKIVKRK